MKKVPKLAALCAVFLLSCFLFSPVALAVEETPEPHTPAIAATESAIPTEDGAEAPPDDGADESGAGPATSETDEGETGAAPPEETKEPTAAMPNGTGTVIETATEEDGREFYTITTPAGNVFYLIIDFSKQMENVYFLDAVTEKDLLALAEKADDGATGQTESVGILPGTETEDSGTDTPEPTPAPQAEQEAQNDSLFSMIIIIVVVAGVGGAGFYFKVYRKRKEANMQDEYEADELGDGGDTEYETEEQENGYDDYVEDQEDDTPPWDDEPGENMEEQEDEEK